MITGVIYGFNPKDTIDVRANSIRYKWTQGDILDVMKMHDRVVWDRYKVHYIANISYLNRSFYKSNTVRANHPYFFRISFMMSKDNGSSGMTVMDVWDMVGKIRQVKLERVVGDE